MMFEVPIYFLKLDEAICFNLIRRSPHKGNKYVREHKTQIGSVKGASQ
jgi:hypothetical protein